MSLGFDIELNDSPRFLHVLSQCFSFAIRTRRYGTESGGSFFKTFLKLFYTHMFNFTPPIAYLRGFILYVVAVVFQQ
ncbi:unnamed protein product [Adineta ricciae]|uniref:Uncharacterized protein n=1 Tax=Adineta ricciae TaxID=249248 RepID=A0A815G5U2_ADIRI|nr:unnamed protein product [Adineta ricciae]